MTRPARPYALSALLLLAVLAAAAVAASLWRSSHAPAAAPGETIVIATNTEYIGTCAVLAAQDQQMFAKYGLAVRILPFTSGKQALNAVLTGKADVATAADIALMFAAMERAPIQVLSTIFRTERDHGIVARRDRGIAAPADLKGKRIGATLSTSGHFTLDVFLNRQRLSAADVQLFNYAPDRLQAALASGEVDAVAGWEPYLDAIAEQQGANALRFSGEEVYDSIYNLIAQRRYVHQHPDTVVRILRALDEGSRYCRGHPAEAIAFVPALTPARKAALQQSWRTLHFGLELDQGLLLALEDQARWAVKGKLTTRQDLPNFLDYIYMDGLSAISPFDVSIIH
jgi:NitT/TauT family transport system substrate-binding protein